MLRATALFALILVILLINYVNPAGQAPPATPGVGGVTVEQARQTEAALLAAIIPARDLFDLTARLKLHQTTALPHTTRTTPLNKQVGDEDTFNVANILGKSYYTLDATVRFVTDHAYWYVANDHSVDMQAVENSTRVFEEKIYPNNHRYFGTEWSPGMDADVHITILLADIKNVGGYFSSADEYPPAVNKYSNQREMMYIASEPSDVTGAGNYFEGTIVHEHQHMIHWNNHRERDLWLDEGCAETAMRLSGYDVGGSDGAFLDNPNVQLTTWDETPSASIPHYGAAYLFVGYLMEHYGQERILQSLLASPGSGIEAVDKALERTGQSARFNDVFKDWTVANYLNDKTVAEGRYYYPTRGSRPADVARRLIRYPDSYNGTVHEYAAEYIGLERGQGDTTVTFDGAQLTPLLTTTAHSGSHVWYSNRRDTANTTLSREFDLSGQSKATLDYWTWFDIEGDFDYGYVEASGDGGLTWATLPTKYSTNDDPNGANYGHGYTGASGNGPKSKAAPQWVHEQLDLQAYVGKRVLIRFDYVTDEGFNKPSWALDDISIPEIGYSSDAEINDGGWQAAGWVRVAPVVPQSWYVAAIEYGAGGPTVQELVLDTNQHGTLNIPGLGSKTTRAILVIAALAPTTTEQATYKIGVQRTR